MCLGVDLVVIAPAFSHALEDSGFLEFADQPKSSTFGDTDFVRDIAEPRIRVLREANEHMGVVAEESPVLGGLCHKEALAAALHTGKVMIFETRKQ